MNEKVFQLKPDSVVETRSKGPFDGRSAGIDEFVHNRLVSRTQEDWEAQARLMRGHNADSDWLLDPSRRGNSEKKS